MTKFPAILKNKYVIATIIFIVVILFLDENNLFVSMRLRRDVNRLQQEEKQLQNDIVNDSILVRRLTDDPEALERYARLEYFMKAPDEDIFVVKED